MTIFRLITVFLLVSCGQQGDEHTNSLSSEAPAEVAAAAIAAYGSESYLNSERAKIIEVEAQDFLSESGDRLDQIIIADSDVDLVKLHLSAATVEAERLTELKSQGRVDLLQNRPNFLNGVENIKVYEKSLFIYIQRI